ncbi:MAG: GntR family transcriptional regulator [Pigmentiphaga sp.]|uniref:GntR family transcriptional regulator n=1 Tax=Pigmentiphaga sp. TaxID=1977564 RepID=UPI0029AC9482|nr:GntR family transcriptional regulator [Pigmentiphaga sp.]MDX3907973.1 GntR family transcriptional regulator [Pigmentiphaga sp.]
MPPATMPPGATQSIGSSLAEVLRDRIVTGVYPPGMWIRESALAEEFGYSNGPIREALQLLVSEELLVREPWRGVRVVELSGDEIVEIFQLRAALLELAAELAASHITAAQLEEGRRMLLQLEKHLDEGDIKGQMALGHSLNHWVCECSGNRRLAQNWSRFTSQARMYFHTALRNSTDPDEVSEPWRQLIAALERRDVVGARGAARRIVRRPLIGLGLSPGL